MRSVAEELRDLLARAAREAAIEWGLPFALETLRADGEQGMDDAYNAYNKRTLNDGQSLAQFAGPYVQRKVEQGAKRLCAEYAARGKRRPRPPTRRIREALQTFDDAEWREILSKAGVLDLEVLRYHLAAHKAELERSLGRRKCDAILISARERGLRLSVQEAINKPSRQVPVTDPLWALFLREQARYRKMQLGSQPGGNRSADEMSRPNAIAEELDRRGADTSPYKVGQYLERMERVPLEAFEGNAFDYFTMIASTRRYNSYVRSRGLKL